MSSSHQVFVPNNRRLEGPSEMCITCRMPFNKTEKTPGPECSYCTTYETCTHCHRSWPLSDTKFQYYYETPWPSQHPRVCDECWTFPVITWKCENCDEDYQATQQFYHHVCPECKVTNRCILCERRRPWKEFDGDNLCHQCYFQRAFQRWQNDNTIGTLKTLYIAFCTYFRRAPYPLEEDFVLNDASPEDQLRLTQNIDQGPEDSRMGRVYTAWRSIALNRLLEDQLASFRRDCPGELANWFDTQIELYDDANGHYPEMFTGAMTDDEHWEVMLVDWLDSINDSDDDENEDEDEDEEPQTTVTIAKIDAPRDIECSICFNTLEESSNVVVLICNHEFHQPCFAKWGKSCPNCRRIDK